jgi:sec-independent protein translocase protein TatA
MSEEDEPTQPAEPRPTPRLQQQPPIEPNADPKLQPMQDDRPQH